MVGGGDDGRGSRDTGGMSDRRFLIRPATPEDAAGCAYVHHTSWVETYGDLLPASHWDEDTAASRIPAWQRSLDRGRDVTVAVVGERIVGVAFASPARTIGVHEPVRERELSSLYVLAAHHGTGAGQALIDAAVPPGTPGQLWVLESNARARRFYERNGFTTDGARHVDDRLGFAEVRHVR